MQRDGGLDDEMVEAYKFSQQVPLPGPGEFCSIGKLGQKMVTGVAESMGESVVKKEAKKTLTQKAVEKETQTVRNQENALVPKGSPGGANGQ